MFLQKHLGLAILSSYVIDNDQELMGAINNLFKQRRWHLNCNNQTDTSAHERGVNFKNEYKAYGSSATLDSTFTAPNCVMKTLVALNGVDRAAIADSKVLDAMKCQEMFNAKLGKIGQVYTNKNVFLEVKSRYNSKSMFETEEMRPNKTTLFGAQIDRADMENVKRDLALANSQVKELRQSLDDIDRQSKALKMQESEAYNAYQQEKARLNKPKSDRQKYESRIRSLKASLELQEANTNQSAFREQLKKSITTLAMQRAQQAQTYIAALDALFATRKEQDLAELKYTDTKIRLMHYKNIQAQVEDDVREVSDATTRLLKRSNEVLDNTKKRGNKPKPKLRLLTNCLRSLKICRILKTNC